MDEYVAFKKMVNIFFKKNYNAKATIFNACLTKHLYLMLKRRVEHNRF